MVGGPSDEGLKDLYRSGSVTGIPILRRAKASRSLSLLLKPAPGDAHAVTRKLEDTLMTRKNLRNTCELEIEASVVECLMW
jgi:hypothetical protein